MRRLSFVLFCLLLIPRFVSAQQTYTVGYFAITTTVSNNSPIVGNTLFTPTPSATNLVAGMTVLIDRTGANPEVLTVASVTATTFTTTTGTQFVHVASFPMDWMTTPSTPIGTFPIPPASVACNQAPPASQPVVVTNPTGLVFDDPNAAGQVCLATIPTFYSGIPVGKYWAAVRAEDPTASPSVSGWSGPRPFGRSVVLVTPTGLRILR